MGQFRPRYNWKHRRNNCRGWGRLVAQLLGWGPTMYWSPNLLVVVFKKQEISQQVVTRMQDLASEFSKIFRGRGVIPPDTQRRPPPAPNAQPDLWCWDPNLGPPQLSAVVAPVIGRGTVLVYRSIFNHFDLIGLLIHRIR